VVQLGRMIVPPSVIPGLADASSLPSITLTSVTKTVSNKNPDSGDKFGNLFGWHRKKDTITFSQETSHAISVKTSPSNNKNSNSIKNSNRKKSNTIYVDLKADWKFSNSTESPPHPTLSDVSNSGSPNASASDTFSSSTANISSSDTSSNASPVPTSAFRKLMVSELRCKKKTKSFESCPKPPTKISSHPSSQKSVQPASKHSSQNSNQSSSQTTPQTFGKTSPSASGSPLPTPEILRSSPKRRHARRQSPSPDYHQARLQTPTKSTGTPSKQHTPRKDTPKKKRQQRFQCRNAGCKDYFSSKDSRDKHETHNCRMRKGAASVVTMETVFSVPSHAELNLDPLLCHYPDCLKTYKNEKSRKKHELEIHRFIEQKGRTVSPVSIPGLSSRPTSCPPSIDESVFTTPSRPVSKKRRRTTSSRTPTVNDSSPATPNLILTPSYQFSPSSLLSNSFDFETQQLPDSLNLNNQCPFCLAFFKNARSLKTNHRCPFQPDYYFLQTNFISPTVLTRPKNWEESLKILNQLSKEDIVKLCTLQNWSLPCYYPIVFPHQHRSGRTGGVPLIDTMTASNFSGPLLKKMLDLEREIKLPKHIILKDEASGLISYLSPKILEPTSEFSYTETSDSFLVSFADSTEHHDKSGDISAHEEDDFNLFSDESDESDVLYSFHGPIPRTETEELPSPPYTPITSREGVAPDGGEISGESMQGGFGEGCDRRFRGDTGRRSEGESGGADLGGGGGVGGGSGGGVGGGSGGGVGGGGGTAGDGGDDGGGDGDDESSDMEDQGDDEMDVSEDEMEHGLFEQAVLNLLPAGFDPGCDGMGAKNIKQRQAASYFREPWKFTDEEIQNLVRCTKRQFFELVLTCVGAQYRSSGLNIFGQCFLMLYKLCHQVSFVNIGTLFGLKHAQIASDVFYRHLLHQYKTNCNIPAIIHNQDVNQAEVDKLLGDSFMRTPIYFKALLKDFEDPSGRNRRPVALNIDGTYFDVEGSADIESQKYMFYGPRAGHVAKFINLTDLCGKFVGILPVASSQSPSSGDGLLLAKHIELQDTAGTGQYIRYILRGNEEFFVIIISDAGFVVHVPNAPTEARGPNAVTLASVCLEEHCVLLHTSTKHERYHLGVSPQGKIRKLDWTPNKPSLDENTVKFSRHLRKTQEQIHASLKSKFKITDMRHLWNESLLPLTSKQLVRFGLPEAYKNIPRLNFIAIVCCSLVNSQHPGFVPLYMSDPLRSARVFLKRLLIENPLLHPEIWPVVFTAARTSGTQWVEISFRDLAENDVIGFPKLDRDSINPVALDIASGPHAIKQADSLLTYMNQGTFSPFKGANWI
jgi:hypothetical protein